MDVFASFMQSKMTTAVVCTCGGYPNQEGERQYEEVYVYRYDIQTGTLGSCVCLSLWWTLQKKT